MPNVKISELPAASTPLAGTELVPVVQGGATEQVTIANLTAGRAVSASDVTVSNLTASQAVLTDANKKLVSQATTGTGNVVRATGPTMTLTNATGLPLTTGVTGTLPVANGGTGLSNLTANQIPYGAGTSSFSSSVNLTFDGSTLTINGISAGRGNQSVATNTAFGTNALSSVNTGVGLGSQNVAVGHEALKAVTGGYNNTAVGRNAGIALTTGFNNVAIGNRALESASSHDSNIAIGHAALAASVNVGNTAVGTSAGASLTTTAYSVALGRSALNGAGIVSMDRCIAIGNEAGSTATNGIVDAIMIGASSTATGSNAIAIGVSTTAAANTIRMGNASITTANIQVAWTVTSDARAKEQVSDLDLGLEFAKALRPVSFKRIGSEQEELGFIAQEVEAALPRQLGLVQKDAAGVYGLRQNDLIAVLVKAVQELSARVETLEAKG